MLYRITNKGPARTVTYLAVFTEGETRDFTVEEIKQYQNMNGVPLASTDLANEDQFDVVVITGDDEEEGED
jgi:hypothetical protein